MSLQQSSLRRSSEDHWIPLSDLMTGLMMVFLVIAILFMIKVEREAKQAELQAHRIAEQAETIKLRSTGADAQVNSDDISS